MTARYLKGLEDKCLEAAATLNAERYYEYEFPIVELIREAKHYQQLTESLLDGLVGVPQSETEQNLTVARQNDTWYERPEG